MLFRSRKRRQTFARSIAWHSRTEYGIHAPVFFGHSYIIDGKHGLFPTSPADFMTTINGEVEPTPMANGKLIDIAPDEPLKHITIRTTDDNNLSLFDGRNKQQNGNFVVRTLLPAGKTGKIAEWFITAETQSDWVRKPVDRKSTRLNSSHSV